MPASVWPYILVLDQGMQLPSQAIFPSRWHDFPTSLGTILGTKGSICCITRTSSKETRRRRFLGLGDLGIGRCETFHGLVWDLFSRSDYSNHI